MLLTLCFFVPSVYICVALMAITYNSGSACILSLVQIEISFVCITYNFTSVCVLMSELITHTHKQQLAHCECTWSEQIDLTSFSNAFSMICC
jgi:hypothetical protein